MFAEEEWTDSPSPDGSSLTVKVSPASAKKKAVAKQSLLRTLQTLASAPVWEVEEAVEDSDEEKDASTAVKKPKKKRCKKRKRKSPADNEGKQKDEEDSEAPAKKNKTMRKKPLKKSSSVASEEPRADQLKEDRSQMEKKLSRQQWKNRMKNKRRCKNKYQQNTTDETKGGLKEETSVQTQDSKEPKKKRTSRKTKKIVAENGLSSITDNAVNISHEAGEQVKSTKLTRKSQIQAEKLRRFLKPRSPAGASKASEEAEGVMVKGEEEQAPPPDPSTALRAKMEKQLEAARFRFINEKLYSSSSAEARRMFLQDPDAIAVYHKGYSAQVQHWPTNPVDSIISYICQKPPTLVVADFGCGDCKIARSVRNKVHSFDLAPVCDLATACDMAKVPLRDSSVDIAVFCLSLMGTNLADFLTEANRVLVMGGVLKIAEVASRFENVHSFIRALSNLGFKIVNKDTENSHFYSFEFIKTRKAPENGKKFGLQLKPCLYKKR